MAKKPIVGTIAAVFDGLLDGLVARLVRRTKTGYTVQLLEAKPPFHIGDTVHLSPAEFCIHPDRPPDLALKMESPVRLHDHDRCA
jgi:hypothetical protein